MPGSAGLISRPQSWGSHSDLDAVAAALNTRPRKALGWGTPAEALNNHLILLSATGVVTTP